MNDGTSGADATRYLAISRELARDIYAGVYPVGSLLPAELALAKRYRVSRQTIREAMRILGNMGLVVRRRGVGTTIVAATPIPAFSQFVGSMADLQQYAHETHLHFDRIEHVLARGVLAERLDCPPSKVWLRGEGWRMAGDAEPPLCWTEVYIDDAFGAVEADLGSRAGLVFDLLAKRFGLVLREVRQRFSAVPMPHYLAQRLRVLPGSPALQVERRYFAHRPDPVEIAISLHPGERYRYAMTLTSSNAAAERMASVSRVAASGVDRRY